MTSDGIRSGVNWSRLKSRSSAAASALTSSVLATPGHAFEQDVAADQERGEEARDHAVLADDDLGDLAADGEDGVAGVGVRRRSASLGQLIGAGRRASLSDWATSCRIVSGDRASAISAGLVGRRGSGEGAQDQGPVETGPGRERRPARRAGAPADAEPVAKGARPGGPQDAGGLVDPVALVKEVADRDDQLGTRQLHRLGLESPAGPGAGLATGEQDERDDELDQRPLTRPGMRSTSEWCPPPARGPSNQGRRAAGTGASRRRPARSCRPGPNGHWSTGRGRPAATSEPLPHRPAPWRSRRRPRLPGSTRRAAGRPQRKTRCPVGWGRCRATPGDRAAGDQERRARGATSPAAPGARAGAASSATEPGVGDDQGPPLLDPVDQQPSRPALS